MKLSHVVLFIACIFIGGFYATAIWKDIKKTAKKGAKAVATTTEKGVKTVTGTTEKGAKAVAKETEKVVKTGAEAAKKTGMEVVKAGETISTAVEKPISKLRSETKANPAYKPYTPPAVTSKPNAFSILSYNIFLRNRALPKFKKDGQIIRVGNKFLPQAIGSGYDVLVLSEAFDNDLRKDLLSNLKKLGYPYRTPVVGSKSARLGNGGVIIVSRHPITTSKERVFGDACVDNDCLAEKGVMYAKINKLGKNYHVFGTHTQSQSGKGNSDIRNNQFALIRRFISEQKIPQNEPVFIVGDLNVDKLGQPQLYQAMLQQLNATQPTFQGHPSSESGLQDALSGGKKIYDYVLVRNQLPKKSYNHIIPLLSPKLWRESSEDKWHNSLSDHFPVHGYFEF